MSCVAGIRWVAVATILSVAPARAESPLDKLDPEQVSLEEHRSAPEKDVVAVLLARTRRGTAAAFSPEGKVLATNGEGHVQLWTFGGARPILREMVETDTVEIATVAFAPDGKSLALGWAHRTLRIYDPASGRLQAERSFERAEGAVQGLSYSPDGKLLAIASGEQVVHLLGVPNEFRTRLVLEHPFSVTGVVFSPNGRMVATWGNGPEVRLWEVSTGKERAVLRGNQGSVKAVAFSPDGQTVASGQDKGVTLWDIGLAKERTTLKGEFDRVFHLAYGPDGKLLAGDNAGHAVVWDEAEKKVAEWKLPLPVCRAAWAPDGKHLAIGDYERVYIMRLPRRE